MKRLGTCSVALVALALLSGSNCSRARVESMNLVNEGVVAAQRKDHMAAIEALERAGAVDPTNGQAFYNLALVHIELRKFDRAKDDLQRAIVIAPGVAGYHEKLGTVMLELGDLQGAKAAFEKAIETDPELFKAYYKLGQVLERLDDQQNALHRYTDAVKKGPRFLEGYASLGRLYADLGYLDQSVQVLQSALHVAQPGTEEEANVHHLLGTVYQQQRKYAEAVAEFRKAIDVVPGMRDALFSLGWTYVLMNNREEGRRYLKRFVDIAGADAPAHYVKAAQDKLSALGEGP